MTREELIALREKLLLGDPPYTVDQFKNRIRPGGVPGLDERKGLGGYDTNAAGVRLALEACLQLTQHLLDRMKKP